MHGCEFHLRLCGGPSPAGRAGYWSRNRNSNPIYYRSTCADAVILGIASLPDAKLSRLTRISNWEVDVMAEVRLQEGETLENALRRFKRKVLQEDIIKEVKRHAFYLKPGQKRRVKQALARKRNRKKLRREPE